MPLLEQLEERLPEHARDQWINLGAIAGSTALTPAQPWTMAVASAAATKHRSLLDAISGDAPPAAAAIAAAKGAPSIMAMTNVYYRAMRASPRRRSRAARTA